jgi:hypothetical protein
VQAFHDRWQSWWENTGRAGVMGLLDEHDVPTDPWFNGPYWSEAEAIGDLALYGGSDREQLEALLSDLAEDMGREPDPARQTAAAGAIADWLGSHAPSIDR